MHLTINGELRSLADIRDFRKTYDLPSDFGVALFEPKDYTGLASIEQAGDTLQGVRQTTLEIIPPEMQFMMLMPFMEQLTKYFRVRLNIANAQINLKEEEIDFAVNGFEDIGQQIVYAIIHAKNTRTPMTDFNMIYEAWLDGTVRVSTRIYEYDHNGTTWRIKIINNIYGRVGLVIDTGDETFYVRDAALACPAQGFMYNMMKEVAERVRIAIV